MFYEIKNKGDKNTDVYLYEEIGADPWTGEGTAAKQFTKDFAAISTPNITLRVNSPGGSVFDGQAIYNAIARHPSKVTAYVDGLAASIASLIVQAADRRVMAKNSLMMIHRAWGVTMGNAKDMRDMADVLEKVDGTIVGVYADRTGKSSEALSELMEAESWFDPEEAVAIGLADEVGEEMKVAASFDLSKFKHPPQALVDEPAEDEPQVEAEPEVPDVAQEPAPVVEDAPQDGQGEEPITYPLPPL